jgi:hypothetical protein
VPSFIRTGLPLASMVVFAIASGASGCGADSGGGVGTGAFSGAGAQAGSGAGGTGGLNLGGSSGTGIDGGGGTGGLDFDSGCAAETHKGELIPANLLFVIDRSGSMNCNLPTDGQSTAECESFPAPKDPAKDTKWKLTRDALKLAITNLKAAGNTSAGLDVFPNAGSDCLVDSDPNINVVDLNDTQEVALHTFLDNVAPQGKTPLTGATILSYAHLQQKIKQGSLPGNKFVVLLTDGFETCGGDISELLQKYVPGAADWGMRTFVIGVPGSEDGRALLSQIAYLGGTAKSANCVHDPAPANVGDCHFDMTKSQNFSQDLQAALNAISGTVLSCELDMPQPKGGLPDYNNVKVLIGSGEIPSAQGQNCDTANGWQYNQDKTKIFLCGSACEAAKQPTATVQIYVPCGIQ